MRYRRSCLQSEVRSYLYATWHSVLLKTNEVWDFDSLRFRDLFSDQIICRLQWNIFSWTLLLVEFDWYSILAALCHTVESEFGIGWRMRYEWGSTLSCGWMRIWDWLEFVVKRSRLFMHDEPKSSVRCRRSCLQSEVRSYLYATWHSVVLKTNEVWMR